ncbi:iron complex outermembrane recepter protein [Arsukibacterium tuosuense]|uniref:Iron complex outermembrane recepter protein n=1 Tax=Arsukibacterium tuosuense TaxID=1323745 RepID=A0A285J510_9GAMM|nr:TonB-dependent receptor [Arsukibacterium tuosuense]SNY55288.1 iron complex outermembrane recepter protein [Arsukibacterium tuosuense]
MYTNNKLNKAVRLAIAFGAASATAFTASVTAAEEDESAKVERIEVTGSRIKRTDLEGALPVTVIDREAIELSGEISVADLIRNTTFNSAGSFRPQSGSSAQGVSQVNMRGLGASRTLVLVDGRRLTMSPSTGSSQDLNSIPMAAVERIEILSDGASAVYGSDAIGGVINVITRKDFSGVELSVGAGEVSVPSEGGDRENGSVVFGSANDTTQVIGGVSWNKRAIIFENAFPWVQPGSSIYGNNWRGAAFDGFRTVPGGCNEENFIPTVIADLDRCQFNFNATNANEASTGNESLFVKLNHQINDDWSVYANASVAKTTSFGRYAPAPDSNIFYDGLATPVDSYNNPTNPDAWMYDANNPNAVAYDAAEVGANQEVFFYHRFAAMGNRDNTIDNENVDFLIGSMGRVGEFDLDFGARRVRNQTVGLGDGYLAASTAWGNVNNFNPGYCADGSFDPAACRFGYDIQNPGSNPSNVLQAGVVTTARKSQFDINEYYASVAFDMFEMAGGISQGSVGVERREEVYSDKYDSQSAAGLVGGSSGSSAGGDRSVNAAYFEALLPATDDLEVSLAGRFDNYSDYGSDFSPKVGLRYEAAEGLLLRASYGLGFRAPSLDILTQATSFSADSVADAVTCEALTGDPEEPCQINAYYIANPDLASESSTQYAFGAAYQYEDWLFVKADYYNIEIEDRIRQFDSQTLINREASGDPIPAGLGVTRDATGLITRIDAGYGNEGTLETSGIDFNIRTNFDFGNAGRLINNLYVSHILDYSVDGGRNNVEDPGLPQQRINLNNQYVFGDFDFAWNINMIGSQYNDVLAGGVQDGHIATWTTHDLQVTYNAPWNARISVGAQNAFEKLPQFGTSAAARGSRDYNFNLYNAFGRVTYIRYTQSF